MLLLGLEASWTLIPQPLPGLGRGDEHMFSASFSLT